MSRQNCSFVPSLSASARCRRHQFRFAILAGALFVGLLASAASAQSPPPLSLFRNYFVTGDYVVGGVGLQGLGVNGFASGTITIPDTANQPNAKQVPAGADIVAAFLYWQTVESSHAPGTGQNGFFNGFAISGSSLPSSSQAPVSWSTGGCSGSSNGSKILSSYRADVRPYLKFDAQGRVVGNGSYVVQLPDSGSNGGGVPLTLGATLVVIYRVLSPNVPLNSIVIYDGDFAPVNQATDMSLPISGFYDAANSPVAEMTQIVGNGQPNKSETVALNSVTLNSIYGASVPPFPGIYNHSWDNPTWPGSAAPVTSVAAGSSQANTLVAPSSSNSGCVVWGAVIFGTTVQDTDNDGLLDNWEDAQGYTDVVTNRWVPLPGADKNTKDVFVNLDYLTNLDGKAGAYLHSHLPKQQAIDQVGAAFKNAPVDCDALGNCKGINLHFDLGASADPNAPQIYPGDPYVMPDTAASNAIPESTVMCTDSGAGLCEFPGQVAVGWKTGLLYFEYAAVSPTSTPTVGYFDQARKDSYHYVLFGHALGLPLSYWTAYAAITNNPTIAQLTSITVAANTATVKLQTPATCAGSAPSPCFVYPGEQIPSGNPAFGDTNLDRITITDAINFPALNGTYIYSSPTSSTANGVTTTSFTIPTTNVPDGTYTFANEPRLAVLYAGPSSTSGHSDIGGAESLITFGLWPADDPANCQPDPSKPAANYCNNQVGSAPAQAGTLMHELGHSFTLTHGGTYYANNSSQPSYGVNCKPNYQSVMSYLFQIRGFPEGGPIDYSRQILPNLGEDALSESTGLGLDANGKTALHATRWYALPNSFDLQLGNRTATMNCDGSPLVYGEPGEVRVQSGPAYPGQIVAGTNVTNSSPIDWNNDLTTPNGTWSIDANLDGQTESATANPPSPMVGFNDWQSIDFRQIGARTGAGGFSGGVGLTGGGGVGLTGGGGVGLTGGGGVGLTGGGGTPSDLTGGNGVGLTGGGGVGLTGGGGVGLTGGGGVGLTGGGGEVDYDIANSTVDAPTGLQASLGNKVVLVSWNPPAFGQIRSYLIYRLLGTLDQNKNDRSFNPLTNAQLIATVPVTLPPAPSYTFPDSTAKNNTTYTYYAVAVLADGRKSGVSNGAVIFVKF